MLTRAAATPTAAGVESVRPPADLLKASYAPAVRLNAARSILDLGVELRSLVQLEDRLLDLEDRVKRLPPEAAGRGAYP